jgi:hypothetical protein
MDAERALPIGPTTGSKTCTPAHFAIPTPGTALSTNDRFCSASLHSLVTAQWRLHHVPTRSPPPAALPSRSRACRQIARDSPRRRAIQVRSTPTRAALRHQVRKVTHLQGCSRCRRTPTRLAGRSRPYLLPRSSRPRLQAKGVLRHQSYWYRALDEPRVRHVPQPGQPATVARP